MKKVERIEPTECPECGYVLNASVNMNSEGAPEPGDYTVCGRCRSFLVFTDEMGVRLLTEEEIADMDASIRAEMVQIREMVRDMPQDDTRYVCDEFDLMAKRIAGIISAHGYHDQVINDIGVSKKGMGEILEVFLNSDLLETMAITHERIGRDEALTEAIDVARELDNNVAVALAKLRE